MYVAPSMGAWIETYDRDGTNTKVPLIYVFKLDLREKRMNWDQMGTVRLEKLANDGVD